MPQWDHWSNYTDANTTFIAFIDNNHADQRQEYLQGRQRDRPFEWLTVHWKLLSPELRSSQFFWYGLVMNQYFSPNARMRMEAVDFLLRNGVAPNERFIVAHLRHGSKGVEQALIQPEQYAEPIKAMLK